MMEHEILDDNLSFGPKGTVEITRVAAYANSLRTIDVYINNQKIGKIKNGETKTFELDLGPNEIAAKIDWCKTKPLTLDIKETEAIKLELGSNTSGWKLILSLFYVLLNPSNYLYLKKV